MSNKKLINRINYHHSNDKGDISLSDDSCESDGAEEETESRVILQVVTPSSESVLSELPGEELLKWKNIQLKRLNLGFVQSDWETGEASEGASEDVSEGVSEEASEEASEANKGGESPLLDLNISIWQLTDTHPGNTKGRKLDSSVFCPQLDAFLIFYDVKEPGTLREWLAEGTRDIRLRGLNPIIIGTYKKGESTQHFQKIFGQKKGVFLWQVGDYYNLKRIYCEILELLFLEA